MLPSGRGGAWSGRDARLRGRRDVGSAHPSGADPRCVPGAHRIAQPASVPRAGVRLCHALVHDAVLPRVSRNVCRRDRGLWTRSVSAYASPAAVSATGDAGGDEAGAWRDGRGGDSGACVGAVMADHHAARPVHRHPVSRAVGNGKTSACMYPYVSTSSYGGAPKTRSTRSAAWC